ncbi:hypothetical protein RvY_12096 [Ramazzottius varieornatus]|uniref:Thyrotropin-releasing hormone receptor n=1 Tax=Ramazzottius varieornatus TaxID=947166 RepID=A0A1D1VIC8_RAMVA|nr:hypothetical protein RvY_12096 [Ramazzottius varieornatus]
MFRILAFTLEQYIAICGDCSRRFHMSDRTNKYVLGIWICSVLYCAPWLGLTHVQPDADDHTRQQCELRLTRETYIGFFGADLLLFYVLPLIIALFVYTKIVFLLFKSARYCSRGSPCLSLSRSNLNEASNSNSQQVTPVLHYTKGLACTTSATMLFGRVLNHQVSENIEERRGWLVQSRSQVTRMLIAIVIFFAIAWLPYRGLLVYNTFQKEEWLDIWYVFFAKTLIYANSAMNPYLYNAMSRRFRLAVYRTLCRASAKKKKQLSKKRTLYQRPPRYEEPQFEPVPQQRGRLRTL